MTSKRSTSNKPQKQQAGALIRKPYADVRRKDGSKNGGEFLRGVAIHLKEREVRVRTRKLPLTPQFFDLYCYLALERLQGSRQGGFVETSIIKGLRGWRNNDVSSIGKQIRRHITELASDGLLLIEGIQKTAGPFRLVAAKKDIHLDVPVRDLVAYMGALSEREALSPERERQLYRYVDWVSKGSVRLADGLLDDSLQAYGEALACASESYQVTTAMSHMARILERQGKYDDALKLCNQVLRELRRAGQQKSWAEAACKVVEGWIELRLRNFSKAQSLFNKALETIRDTGHFQILGDAHNGLGVAAKHGGDFKEALSHYQQALEFWIMAEYLYGIQSAYFNIGHLHYAWGKQLTNTDTRLALQQYRTAQAWMEQCISLCEAAGTGYDKNDAEVTLSSIYRRTGNMDKAIETAETAKQIAIASGNAHGLFLAYRSLLKTHLIMRNTDRANQVLREATEVLSSEYIKELTTISESPVAP